MSIRTPNKAKKQNISSANSVEITIRKMNTTWKSNLNGANTQRKCECDRDGKKKKNAECTFHILQEFNVPLDGRVRKSCMTNSSSSCFRAIFVVIVSGLNWDFKSDRWVKRQTPIHLCTTRNATHNNIGSKKECLNEEWK